MKQNSLKELFIDYLVNEHFITDYRSMHFELNKQIKLESALVLPTVSECMTTKELPLEDLLNNAKQSLSLGSYIREKAFQRNMVTYWPTLFELGQISRDYWSRLLNDEVNASKEKLLRVAVLLRLSSDDAEELLEKAGYSLSQTILRDVVISYCLNNRIYDFVAIEELLSDYDVQSLFNYRRGSRPESCC